MHMATHPAARNRPPASPTSKQQHINTTTTTLHHGRRGFQQHQPRRDGRLLLLPWGGRGHHLCGVRQKAQESGCLLGAGRRSPRRPPARAPRPRGPGQVQVRQGVATAQPAQHPRLGVRAHPPGNILSFPPSPAQTDLTPPPPPTPQPTRPTCSKSRTWAERLRARTSKTFRK